MMTTDLLLKIALAVLTIVSALVTGWLIPLLNTKTTSAQRKHAMTLVKYAVLAAEQIYKDSGMGTAKKAYVIEHLKKQGIKLEMADLDMLIESAVKEMNHWQKEVEKEN